MLNSLSTTQQMMVPLDAMYRLTSQCSLCCYPRARKCEQRYIYSKGCQIPMIRFRSLIRVCFSSVCFHLYRLLRLHFPQQIEYTVTVLNFSEMHPGVRERSIHGADGGDQHVRRPWHNVVLQADLSWHVYQVNNTQSKTTAQRFNFYLIELC